LKEKSNFWGFGSDSEGPKIQVDCSATITNLYPSTDIKILRTVLKLTGGVGDVVVCYLKSRREAYSGKIAPISPNETVDLNLHFFENPGFEKEGMTLKSDVVFFDQFGKEYKIKNV